MRQDTQLLLKQSEICFKILFRIFIATETVRWKFCIFVNARFVELVNVILHHTFSPFIEFPMKIIHNF